MFATVLIMMEDNQLNLIDIGVNLTHDSFAGDLGAVLTRAADVGVIGMVVTGTSIDESCAAQALAARYPGVLYATAGVHPHAARHWNEAAQQTIHELAAFPEVVAIGETGLDFNRDFSPRPMQERVFEAQLEMAAALNMPVFMHERDASERFIAILSRYRERLPRAVIHCFTGSAEELSAYLELDLHIGITGWICDERRGIHLRELVGRIPLQRLMLETDAPYLLPRNLTPKPKSRRNEPAYLQQILDTVAECMRLPVQMVAEQTTKTAKAFFAIF